jgi:hypothetical protein
MGMKLLWTGLTIIHAAPLVIQVPAAQVVGAVLMVIGCVLMWLDK